MAFDNDDLHNLPSFPPEGLIHLQAEGATVPVAQWETRDKTHIRQVFATKEHVILLSFNTEGVCDHCGGPVTEAILQLSHAEANALMQALGQADAWHVKMMAGLN